MDERRCHNCSREVGPETQLYILKIQMYASPEVILPPHTPGMDTKAEMQALIDSMEFGDVEESTAQVYESYEYNLCSKCRSSFHIQLKRAKQVGFGI